MLSIAVKESHIQKQSGCSLGIRVKGDEVTSHKASRSLEISKGLPVSGNPTFVFRDRVPGSEPPGLASLYDDRE